MNYSEIKIGQKASVTKTFKDEDVRKFAEVSMDVNPIHLDDEYAKKTVFGQRIVHGILTCGLISAVLAQQASRRGNYLSGAGSEIYVARAFGRHNHRRGGSRGDERRQTHHQAQHRLQKSGRQGGCLRRRDRKTRLI